MSVIHCIYLVTSVLSLSLFCLHLLIHALIKSPVYILGVVGLLGLLAALCINPHPPTPSTHPNWSFVADVIGLLANALGCLLWTAFTHTDLCEFFSADDAIAEEREACARLSDELSQAECCEEAVKLNRCTPWYWQGYTAAGSKLAAAIRARSNKEQP